MFVLQVANFLTVAKPKKSHCYHVSHCVYSSKYKTDSLFWKRKLFILKVLQQIAGHSGFFNTSKNLHIFFESQMYITYPYRTEFLHLWLLLFLWLHAIEFYPFISFHSLLTRLTILIISSRGSGCTAAIAVAVAAAIWF